MSSTDLESFFEEIATRAVTDTVEKLLRYPFGFHGDTGIRDFLYARLHVHGGRSLDCDDGRPGCSTVLLQAEHYTAALYANGDKPAQNGRFDLALCAPPNGDGRGDGRSAHFAENLRALFAFELGKNKPLTKVVDPSVAGHEPNAISATSDISKLYRELREHDLRQGWTIQFYDSRAAGAPIIGHALEVCSQLPPLPAGKRLRAVFVEYCPDASGHHLSSNDTELQSLLITALAQRNVAASPEMLQLSTRSACSGSGSRGWAAAATPSATVEQVFGARAELAARIIEIGGMEERGRQSGYVNLYVGGTAAAQLHLVGADIGLVLRSRQSSRPRTRFAEIPVASLSGYRGPNKSWLEGTDRFKAKGPAIAFLIPRSIGDAPEDDEAWADLAGLLAHARSLP